jgi:alkylation response protein AidB-like acyl-CoA dehydrogenase
MRWQLSEEQEAYRESFGAWLTAVAPTDVVRGWLDELDLDAFPRRFEKDGWVGVGLSEEQGGQGGGLLELALTAEALGGSAAPSSDWLASVLVAPALSGESGVLLTPAESVPGEAPRLVLDESGRVSGHVPRVLAAGQATRFVAIVLDPEGVLRLRLVEAGDGVLVERRSLLDRSRAVADVTLSAAPSQPVDVDAAQFLQECAARAAVLVAADSLGAMQRMLDLAVTYSKQRRQFGVPIGSFQAVKHAAATILVDVEAARSAIYYAAASVDSGAAVSDLQAAAVKAQVTASGVRAADSALTLHGAIGFTWEHDLHLFYKRAKLNEHLFGAPSRWNDRIADGLDLAAH